MSPFFRGAAAMALVGSSVAVSSALTDAPLHTSQAVRYAAAALLLLVYARARKVPVLRPQGTEWWWLTGVAITGLVVFNVAIVRGVAHAEPAVIAVAVACVPILLGVLGPLLEGRSPTTRVVVAALVVTLGGVLVEGTGRAEPAGVAWAVVALVCEAGFTLCAVPVLRRHGPLGVSVHSVWIGTVLFLVLGLALEGPAAVTRLTADDWAALAYLAVLVTAVAFLLWYAAVARVGAGAAGLLTGLAPVAAALAGTVSAGLPAPTVWCGIAVVVVGLAGGLSGRAEPAGDDAEVSPPPEPNGCRAPA